MLGKVEEKMEERAMVQFMSRFTDHPFLLKFRENEYRIGEGEPAFTVHEPPRYRLWLGVFC